MSGIQKSETAPKRIKGNALIGCFLKREKTKKKQKKMLLHHWNKYYPILYILKYFLAYSNDIFKFWFINQGILFSAITYIPLGLKVFSRSSLCDCVYFILMVSHSCSSTLSKNHKQSPFSDAHMQFPLTLLDFQLTLIRTLCVQKGKTWLCTFNKITSLDTF